MGFRRPCAIRLPTCRTGPIWCRLLPRRGLPVPPGSGLRNAFEFPFRFCARGLNITPSGVACPVSEGVCRG